MPVIWPADLEHRSLTKPALKDRLWRYMDFTKFVAMLVKEGLYLTRLDRLGDAYEGWIPKSPKKYYDGFFGAKYMERDRELKKQSPEFRKLFYVNCWHANDEESDAMWKLYTKGHERIAICTTRRNLEDSLGDAPEELWLYEVMYAGPEGKPVHGGSMLRACMTKRMPFVHEKEVRVVWDNWEHLKGRRKKDELDSGFYVKCKMATLIKQVYIAPTENPWFEPIMKDVLDKYGIKAEVVQSRLNLKPP